MVVKQDYFKFEERRKKELEDQETADEIIEDTTSPIKN